MATGFIKAVMALFPDARVDLVVRQGFEGLPLPHRGEVLSFDKSKVSAGAFGRSLRGRGYSHFFVLPPSFSSAWMALKSKTPFRVGYRGGGRGLMLRPALPYSHPHRSVHLLNEYLGLLSPWEKLETEEHMPGLEANDEWVRAHIPREMAGVENYVVLAPGAEYGPAKQWPLEHYRKLAGMVAGGGHPVVVAGLPKDAEAADWILEGEAKGMNLCGKTDLKGLTAMLARAELVVSNDSGAMHLAAALKRPQIALFGSTNTTWTKPLNFKARIFTLDFPCAPCYLRECRYGHTACLSGIQPKEVGRAALKILGHE